MMAAASVQDEGWIFGVVKSKLGSQSLLDSDSNLLRFGIMKYLSVGLI